MSDRRYQILNGHFQKAVSEPEQYVVFSRDTEIINKFYILIRNISGPYNMFKNAEFLFEMEAPPDFPHKPPTFKALTPNGVYKLGATCCISIGQYHPENYRAVAGIREFPIELANGFIGCTCECNKKCNCVTLDKSGGINLEKHSVELRKQMALESKNYNLKHNKEILENMESQYAEYSKKWKEQLDAMKPEERMCFNFGNVIFEKPVAVKMDKPVSLDKVENKKPEQSILEQTPPQIPPQTQQQTPPQTQQQPQQPQKKKITIKLKKN